MKSDFILEVPVHAYSNPTHAAAPMGDEVVCCDDGDDVSPLDCSNPCDNRFIFCLREFGRTDIDLRTQSCLYGRERTEQYNNNDSLTFTVGEDFPGGVSNPLVFSGTSWPVSLLNCHNNGIMYLHCT